MAARDEFLAVLKIDPKSYKAWENLGLCYVALQADTPAWNAYLRAIEIVNKDYPQEAWPYIDMAELLLNKGDCKTAFDTAVEAAQRNPSSADAAYLAGKALYELNHPAEAERWLRRAATLDRHDRRPHYLLMLSYRKQGEIEKARGEGEVVKALLDPKKTPR